MITQTLTLEDPLWQKILNEIRHDTYHLPGYAALEARQNQSSAAAFLARDGDKIFFVPYLIRSCQSFQTDSAQDRPIFDAVSPYGYSGILLSDAARETPEFANQALDLLQNTFRSQGICAVFFRLHPLLSDGFSELFTEVDLTHNGITISVDLTLPESKIWSTTRKGHQSTINKCKRLGLTARMVPFADYLEDFISIYEETMTRVSAKQTFYFDRAYFESLLSLGTALHCCIVECQDQIVATSLFFESCGIVQAHLGGTRTAFMSQSPFSLLLHSVRLWAKEQGNDYLHLGGGVGGSNTDPLFRFKSGFSRQQHDLYTLRLVVDPDIYDELVTQRAQDLGVAVDQLLTSNFFPAYRTTL